MPLEKQGGHLKFWSFCQLLGKLLGLTDLEVWSCMATRERAVLVQGDVEERREEQEVMVVCSGELIAALLQKAENHRGRVMGEKISRSEQL